MRLQRRERLFLAERSNEFWVIKNERKKKKGRWLESGHAELRRRTVQAEETA